MPENMPVLYQNILSGLPSDFARDVFLWAVERPGEDRMCYRAEAFARSVDAVVRFLRPALLRSARLHGRDSVDPDLLGFVLERWTNHEYGGNIKLPLRLRCPAHA